MSSNTKLDYVISTKVVYLDRDNGPKIKVKANELLGDRYVSPCKIYLKVHDLKTEKVIFNGSCLSYVFDDDYQNNKSLVSQTSRSASKSTMARFLKQIIP